MFKPKVLIINPVLAQYRIPIFNLIAQTVDLTVLHSGESVDRSDMQFRQLLMPLLNLGPFGFLRCRLNKLCKQFDVVVSEGNIRYPDRNLLIMNPKRAYKWICWGIGVSASYKNKFDQNKKFDAIRHFIFKRADANVFYSDYPIDKYLAAGFKRESLFVANNTVQVDYDESKSYTKNSILFVGTLYKQKKIYELLEAYRQVCKQTDNMLPLNIIGGGDEYDNIKDWISRYGLGDKVTLTGPIFDQSILQNYFRKAYACISPGQAGLSVLTSMGYGTPFVTKSDAITGGEIFNIKNNENGVLYSDQSELEGIIWDIIKNSDRYVEMGRLSREYYINKRTPQQMADSLTDAIKYSLECK
ncbi:MAG: glycosyltransferase family 4 protein [Phycisphaerae bacterium]